MSVVVGCVWGTLSFPRIELRGVANEVLLQHGTSAANAANIAAGVLGSVSYGVLLGVVCEGFGANLVSPWPTSSARLIVVPCCLSLWTARGTVRVGWERVGVGVECRMREVLGPAHWVVH